MVSLWYPLVSFWFRGVRPLFEALENDVNAVMNVIFLAQANFGGGNAPGAPGAAPAGAGGAATEAASGAANGWASAGVSAADEAQGGSGQAGRG